MNIDFAWKLYAIFQYGGFEAVSDKWLHETDDEEDESAKPRKQTLTRQQTFKKGRIGISSTHGALFLEKMVCGFQSRTTFTDVNKIKLSECSASV